MISYYYYFYLSIYLSTHYIISKEIRKMAYSNTKELVTQFVQARGADAIPTMSRMLLDRTITDIDVRDSTYNDCTALLYQAYHGTTGSVAWILIQDPPPDIEVRDRDQWTPLMYAVFADFDSEGKVRLLLDHGADRTKENTNGTALDWARQDNNSAAVNLIIDMLENYRPDVSR